MPHRLSLAVVALIVAWVPPARTVAQDPEIRLPLPVVKRAKPVSESSVFERPAIILAGRLSERAEVWRAPDVCCGVVKFPVETFFLFGVETAWVIRLNERSPDDPDLADIGFRFQIDPKHRAAWEPKIGVLYVLFLDTPHYCCTTHMTTHPQIGFEVSEEDSVTPIVKGGELDAYAGLKLEELVKVIQTGKPK